MSKSSINRHRKQRSDKFPLTLHPTGQYCKKIRGKIHYFGAEKRKALERYYEQAADLHKGQEVKPHSKGSLSIKTLCNLYLDFQFSRVDSGDLTERYYADQIKSLRLFGKFVGLNSTVDDIETLDLQKYRTSLMKKYNSPSGVNLNIAIMKAMFHWAKKNEILTHIPNIDAISKVKALHKEKQTFTPKQIHLLIKSSSKQLQAMILLGLNCGFGSTDCANLKWEHIDFNSSRIKMPRQKTGISRDLPLWKETLMAIKSLRKRGELIFYTKKGNPWVRTIKTITKDGQIKYSRYDAVSAAFSNLLKKANIRTEKGVGFYTLRRTAATLAARSGDPFAVQKLLGHADLKMATTYVQDVSKQTDRVINNTRRLIIQDDS